MRTFLVILLLSIVLLSHVFGAPGKHFLIETDGNVAESDAADNDVTDNEIMDSKLYGADYCGNWSVKCPGLGGNHGK